MRLLIAKLAATSVQSVSVAMNAENDVADLATDLESCVRLLRGGDYDLVLLIVSQGRLSARDSIARLRREAGRVPMVVLTEPAAHEGASVQGALAGEARRMAALAGTLDDAMEGMGPGGLPWAWEQAGLMHAADRRAPPPLESSGELDVALDGDAETLRVADRQVSLSQAEFRIFSRLWERRGRIVTAEDLMTSIYGAGERPASRVLPVFLFKLRKKLGNLGIGDIVETAVGRGFTIRSESKATAHS